MTDDQKYALAERFVLSFEKIAAALEHLHETCQRHLEPPLPERRDPREAVVTRVPNAEDRIREQQGASAQPLAEWLSEVEDEEAEKEFIGLRERAWLDAQRQERDAEQPEKADRGEQEG